MNPDNRERMNPSGENKSSPGHDLDCSFAPGPLALALTQKRKAVVKEWLARTLQAYAEHTSRFLLQEKDPFRNPVGQTLKDGLPVLFEEIVGGMDESRLIPALDGIVRVRAVQDFSPGDAVGFVFLLKSVLRDTLKGEERSQPDAGGLIALEARIDRIALLAFELYVKCREKIYELKVNEARRGMYLSDRMRSMRSAPREDFSRAAEVPDPKRGDGL